MSESGYILKNVDPVASTRLDNVSRGLVTPLMAPLITVWGRK